MISHSQNATEVIGRMPPLGGEPSVVVIQPANDATDVPGRLDRVQPKACTRHTRPERHHRTFDNRPQVLGAFREAQCQQAAAQSIYQAVACCVQRLGGLDFKPQNVVGDFLQDLVIVGAVVQVDVGAHLQFTSGSAVFARLPVGDSMFGRKFVIGFVFSTVSAPDTQSVGASLLANASGSETIPR